MWLLCLSFSSSSDILRAIGVKSIQAFVEYCLMNIWCLLWQSKQPRIELLSNVKVEKDFSSKGFNRQPFTFHTILWRLYFQIRWLFQFFFYQNIRSQIPPFPPGLFLMNCFVLLGEGAARFGGYRWVSPPLKSLFTGKTHWTMQCRINFFLSSNGLPTDLRKTFLCVSRSRVNV